MLLPPPSLVEWLVNTASINYEAGRSSDIVLLSAHDTRIGLGLEGLANAMDELHTRGRF